MTEDRSSAGTASDEAAARFPFPAVVGADDAKLALCLAAVDPRIGGVLLRGDKGSAKSTLARGMADLLPGSAPFVELPLGAGEDRVVGALDLSTLLTEQRATFRPGLLADADGGVLHVDEINLLPDHLVDVLLDVAVSGVNRVERDGIAEVHPARFVLVGSMNPEEGELRPQLLDRFGLAVAVTTPTDPGQRADAVARRLAFDRAPAPFGARWAPARAELADRLERAREIVAASGTESTPGAADPELIEAACAVAAAAGAEGLRADLVLCRAAAALAALDGRDRAGAAELRRVASLVLAHRRRHPFGAPPPGDTIDDALDRALGPDGEGGFDQDPPPADDEHEQADPPTAGPTAGADPTAAPPSTGRAEGPEGSGAPNGPGGPAPRAPSGAGGDEPDHSAPNRRRFAAEGQSAGDEGASFGSVEAPAAAAAVRLEATSGPGGGAAGRRSVAEGPRGRVVGTRPLGQDGCAGAIDAPATMRAAAERRALGETVAAPAVVAADLREAVREQRTANLIVLAVDTSGSMFAVDRARAVRDAVLALLVDAYQRRDRVAVVAFRGDRAEVVLRPTGSVEVARARLQDLPTGGRTPLSAGIDAALDLVLAGPAEATHRPLLVVVSDGRATAASPGADEDPVRAAMAAAARVARHRIDAVVLDAESGSSRLGLAAELAEAMGARHVAVDDFTATTVERAVRASLPPT